MIYQMKSQKKETNLKNNTPGPSLTGKPALDENIIECMARMKEWGLLTVDNIEWTTQKMTPMGKTFWFRDSEGRIKISLNDGLVLQPANIIKDTIYHELAHVVAGRAAGHGEQWKRIIEIIKLKTGLQIQRLASLKEISNRYWTDGGYKYLFRCKTCGRMLGFMKKNEFVKHYDAWDRKNNCRRFTHTGCGGEWELISKGGK